MWRDVVLYTVTPASCKDRPSNRATLIGFVYECLAGWVAKGETASLPEGKLAARTEFTLGPTDYRSLDDVSRFLPRKFALD